MVRASTEDQHEPASSELDKNQKRKLRNRLSQRAFRRRQAEYLRDLRNRAEASQKPNNERVVELEEENGRLRAHITELQSRLEGVQVTLQMIASSSSKILGRSESTLPRQSWNEERDSEQEENAPSRNDSITTDKAQSEANPWPSFSSTALEAIQIPDLPFPTDVDSTIEIPTSDAVQARSSLIRDVLDSIVPIDPNLSKSPLQLQRIPNIWNFNYQMGGQSLYQSVSTALAMFNSVTRPDVMNWYAKTRFFHIIELTAWQILPCSLTYSRYPFVVDWIPFASIRDRIIQLHTANPYVDQIFCDTVSAYVVESTLSELVVGGSLMKVYIRVTDLIASMALQGESEGIDNMASLPAPDIKTLFSSPECAYLAFRHLKMDCGASYYKIDPVFFSKYPELCDPSDDIVATGVPLKPGTQTTLTSPNYVDAMTVATYCSFINFSFDAATALPRLEYV
ncbi:hypothetical protein CEP52_003954 [Fusarium oligoseptatum]|uniref:BZIP domain-containing protein n=1 Tax=Fusarium oligoseptatum TaxID=2604345 RepID=A0A428U5T4_9HYPO|nr:hypothetical protein CEP52_003954 [Fusarium oligoseptatum]